MVREVWAMLKASGNYARSNRKVTVCQQNKWPWACTIAPSWITGRMIRAQRMLCEPLRQCGLPRQNRKPGHADWLSPGRSIPWDKPWERFAHEWTQNIGQTGDSRTIDVSALPRPWLPALWAPWRFYPAPGPKAVGSRPRGNCVVDAVISPVLHQYSKPKGYHENHIKLAEY